jgi:hypothetical protein
VLVESVIVTFPKLIYVKILIIKVEDLDGFVMFVDLTMVQKLNLSTALDANMIFALLVIKKI